MRTNGFEKCNSCGDWDYEYTIVKNKILCKSCSSSNSKAFLAFVAFCLVVSLFLFV